MGMVTPLGNDVADVDGRGLVRVARVSARSTSSTRPSIERPHRRGGPRPRRQPCPRPEGAAPHRPLHPARTRRGARGDGPGGSAGDASRAMLAERTASIPGTGLGGVGTLGDGFSTNATRGRIASPIPHPDGYPQCRRGPDRDQLRDDRTQLRDGVGLRDRRPRDRRRSSPDHPPRRRRDDAAGGAEAGIYEGA